MSFGNLLRKIGVFTSLLVCSIGLCFAGNGRTKVVLLGDTSVGKSCVLGRIVGGNLSGRGSSSVGGNYYGLETISPGGRSLELDFWDIAGGNDRFLGVVPLYLRAVDEFILVCDATRPETVDRLRYWANMAIDANNENARFIFLINKADLVQIEAVGQLIRQCSGIAKECGLRSYECVGVSAETGYHCTKESLLGVIERGLDNSFVVHPDSVPLDDSESAPKNSCC